MTIPFVISAWESLWNSTDKQTQKEPLEEQQIHSPETLQSIKSYLGILHKYLNKFMRQLSVSQESVAASDIWHDSVCCWQKNIKTT